MKQIKFTKEQTELIIKMYALDNYSVPEIIKECGFSITKTTIFRKLNKNNIPLVRKKSTYKLIGKTFGYLTIVKICKTEKSTKDNKYRAICKCSCGKDNIDVHLQSLKNGGTTSCGCRRDQYRKTTGKNSARYTGFEELNGTYWNVIKKGAIKRGYLIEIDIEYAWNLYIGQNKKCALSGIPIEFAIRNKSSEATASLDRIDSKKGYIKGNVQWVHKHINLMKNVYNQNYFISLCKSVTEYTDKKIK